jgi:predicted component of type VI protein secretion system
LKNWLQTQKQEKGPQNGAQANVRSFYWKRFECEICKQMYPYTFKIRDTIHKIVDVSEHINSHNSNYILLLTVSPQQSEFKLGRGHESQVRINDISVSRCHAIIKCKKDGFYIEDNTSKFGTIVLLKNKLRLKA